MKNVVLQRVIQVKDAKNLSINRFASVIGMAQPTVNNYFKGNRAISFELIMAILQAFPDVSAEWLMRGKGSMYECVKNVNEYNIKGTDNSVSIGGDSQGDITTNGNDDKEIIKKLLEQNQQLIMMLANR